MQIILFRGFTFNFWFLLDFLENSGSVLKPDFMWCIVLSFTREDPIF